VLVEWRAAHDEREARLLARLAGFESLAIAFSGGVDSAVLLDAATRVLGERAVGVLADSPSLPRRELDGARTLAGAIGARLVVLSTDELSDPLYRRNAGDRCYHCKRELFARLSDWAARHGVRSIAFGEIVDDLADDRPGRRAASERGVVAPLRECGFTKEDVRRYARGRSLAVAEKPASACLASRIPVGTPVSTERLARIERAEESVRALGFHQVRVRDHGPRARLELGEEELAHARAIRSELAARLRTQGFDELELAAYQRGGSAPR
jgi:uncharacterized protein